MIYWAGKTLLVEKKWNEWKWNIVFMESRQCEPTGTKQVWVTTIFCKIKQCQYKVSHSETLNESLSSVTSVFLDGILGIF